MFCFNSEALGTEISKKPRSSQACTFSLPPLSRYPGSFEIIPSYSEETAIDANEGNHKLPSPILLRNLEPHSLNFYLKSDYIKQNRVYDDNVVKNLRTSSLLEKKYSLGDLHKQYKSRKANSNRSRVKAIININKHYDLVQEMLSLSQKQ